MAQTADRHLTPEQEQARNAIDRYAHIAALVTCGYSPWVHCIWA